MNSNNFYNILSESSIADIAREKKIFVMIIGGVASGKSFVYEKYLKHLPLLDIDKYTFKLSGVIGKLPER